MECYSTKYIHNTTFTHFPENRNTRVILLTESHAGISQNPNTLKRLRISFQNKCYGEFSDLLLQNKVNI